MMWLPPHLWIPQHAALFPAGGGAATTTFDSGHKSANLDLGNGDLTVTVNTGGTDANARAIASAASGKKYWEITVDATASAVAEITQGFMNGSATTNTWLGSNFDSWGWAGDGKLYTNGVQQGVAIASWAATNVLCFAVDFTAELFWGRVNGGNWNNSASADPATAAEGRDFSGMNAGPWFAAVHMKTVGDSFTGNFGATAYAQTAPSGFGNW